MEEREDQGGGRSITANEDGENETVALEKVTGKWNKDENEDTLTNIDLSLKSGQLIAIIGPVGSGKVCFLFNSFKHDIFFYHRVQSFKLSWGSCLLLKEIFQLLATCHTPLRRPGYLVDLSDRISYLADSLTRTTIGKL